MIVRPAAPPPAVTGPVDVLIVTLGTGAPFAELLHALATQVGDGVIRLLDVAVVTASGSAAPSRWEFDPEAFALTGLELHAPGVSACVPLSDIVATLGPGESAAVVVVESLWLGDLSAHLMAEAGAVVRAERFPESVLRRLSVGSGDA